MSVRTWMLSGLQAPPTILHCTITNAQQAHHITTSKCSCLSRRYQFLQAVSTISQERNMSQPQSGTFPVFSPHSDALLELPNTRSTFLAERQTAVHAMERYTILPYAYIRHRGLAVRLDRSTKLKSKACAPKAVSASTSKRSTLKLQLFPVNFLFEKHVAS